MGGANLSVKSRSRAARKASLADTLPYSFLDSFRRFFLIRQIAGVALFHMKRERIVRY